jgi:guanine deaminase
MQQLLGDRGLPLAAAHLLHLATSAGAAALGMTDEIGDFQAGKQFDALWLRPAAGTTLDVCLRHAEGPEDALSKAFALATPADVESIWVAGAPVPSPSGAQLAGVGVARPVADAGSDR